MDDNRDWKLIAALILGGLALFVALGGNHRFGNDDPGVAQQQVILQPVAPVTVPAAGTTAPVIVMPPAQPNGNHFFGGWGEHNGFPLVPLLFLGGIVFLVFRMSGRRRYGWGGPGPGGYGRPPWAGYGPRPQSPGQGNPQEQQHYPQSQGEPTRPTDAHGDITRPEGSGE